MSEWIETEAERKATASARDNHRLTDINRKLDSTISLSELKMIETVGAITSVDIYEKVIEYIDAIVKYENENKILPDKKLIEKYRISLKLSDYAFDFFKNHKNDERVEFFSKASIKNLLLSVVDAYDAFIHNNSKKTEENACHKSFPKYDNLARRGTFSSGCHHAKGYGAKRVPWVDTFE